MELPFDVMRGIACFRLRNKNGGHQESGRIDASQMAASCYFNPLRPGIKLQILLLCFHTFLTEVVGRSC